MSSYQFIDHMQPRDVAGMPCISFDDATVPSATSTAAMDTVSICLLKSATYQA